MTYTRTVSYTSLSGITELSSIWFYRKFPKELTTTVSHNLMKSLPRVKIFSTARNTTRFKMLKLPKLSLDSQNKWRPWDNLSTLRKYSEFCCCCCCRCCRCYCCCFKHKFCSQIHTPAFVFCTTVYVGVYENELFSNWLRLLWTSQEHRGEKHGQLIVVLFLCIGRNVWSTFMRSVIRIFAVSKGNKFNMSKKEMN